MNIVVFQIDNPLETHQLETKSLIQLLRAKLQPAELNFLMKLMIIGRQSIGKTTLMHRLLGENNFTEDVGTCGNISFSFIYLGIFIFSFLYFR